MDNKKIERKALYLTFLTNIIFFLLLMIIVAWRETYPPPEEYGIEIGTEFDSDFETDNMDSNTEDEQQNELEDNDSEDNNLENIQPENNTEIENLDDIKNDIVSEDQNIDDNIEIEEENETFSMDSELTYDQNEKNEIEETQSEEEIKKIDERAIFGGSNSSSNSKSASAAGSSLEMQGWTWDFEPKPNDNSSESGRIIFEIIVDYYGEIVGLKTLETTLSPMVENIYREEILKLTFSPTNNNNPADISKGKITFIIKNN